MPSGSWSTRPTCDPTDLLDIYRRFLKLEEHRLKLEHMHGEDGPRAGAAPRRRDLRDAPPYLDRRVGNPIASRTLIARRASPFSRWAASAAANSTPTATSTSCFFIRMKAARPRFRVNDIVQHILYMLWDIGFQVGHATRTMQELVNQANGDLRTKTSLLEARFLCGDEPLFHEFEKVFQRRCLQGHEKEFLEWRVADQRDRARQGRQHRLPPGNRM